MDYFTILDLKKEPFSNSPDPEFFYGSHQHLDCLQRLELTIRLRQGMSVVIGEVGTGKTTLCRQLIRRLGRDATVIDTHLILDPAFASPREFLETVTALFALTPPAADDPDRRLKERIKNHLFQRAVEEGCIVVLLIDEGQKLPDDCLEVLRELLNYETNDAKLLQTVIFAQPEFRQSLQRMPNFADRVATLCQLGPLGFRDTCNMIRFRLQRAAGDQRLLPQLFSLPALLVVWWVTRGYPRKVVMLCSKALLACIIKNSSRVSGRLVLAAARRMGLAQRPARRRWLGLALAACLLLAFLPASRYHLLRWYDALTTAAVHAPPRAPAPPTTPGPEPGQAKAGTGAVGAGPEESPPPATPQPAAHRVAATPPPAPLPVPAAPPASPPGPAAPAPATVAQPPSSPVADGGTADTASVPQTMEATPPRIIDGRPMKIASRQPFLLGRLTLERGDNLSKMIARVYGYYTAANLQRVLTANPALTGIDTLPVGTTLDFPAAIPPTEAPLTGPWRLRLASFPSLEAAYTFVRHQPEEPPLRIIALQPAGGATAVFWVIVETTYASETAARRAAASLAGATVFSHWPPGTILHSRLPEWDIGR